MGVCAGKQKRTVNESNRQRKEGRRRMLIGMKEASPVTTLYDLPMEMLDVIFQKSYLHWILNTPTKQKDDDVIRSLISVDVCFNRRITRQRFKKAIWRYLKDFYENTMKRSAVIRNNRNYLLKTIQPNNEFISSLLSLNCVTEEQCYFIQRQSSKRKKNAVLLEIMRSFNETQFSNFVKCLRQTNQMEVARVVSTGGVVVKVTVINCGGECPETMTTELTHQTMNDLRNRINLKSNKTNECVSELINKGIEILNSQHKRRTVVVWIWCRTQEALEHIQNLYESNQMWGVFFDHIQPSISIVLNIGRNQFKKTAVYAISTKINFTERIETPKNENVHGVTKLRNEIFVFCKVFKAGPKSGVIRVYEDRNPFRLRNIIRIKQIERPCNIGSSEKENCLYVSSFLGRYIWKITKEKGDEHKIMKWLTTGHELSTISASFDGNLLIVNYSSSILTIYGSDAVIIRSIHLPTDIVVPIHAVETSMGNFIILHFWTEAADGWSDVADRGKNWVVSELTRDGQEVIRRFIPANKKQELNNPSYISLDSDDRVFVADGKNGRVILLDSYLKWDQMIRTSKEELEPKPFILCYDKEKKQLIVGLYFSGVIIYTLSQN